MLTEQKVDLMHAHCPITSCLLARSLRAVVDAPLVLTYHTKYDVDIAKAVRGKLLQESAIRALVQNIASCDEVWVVSRGAGENLRSLGYKGDYIVMENGVDVPRGRVSDEAIAAATGRYDLPQNVPIFLFVGRLMWYKGIRIILDALKTLREKNVDFRMVFVGEGADGAEIRSYAEERKLSDRCFFTGAISDREIIRAWYGRSDLFLFPSTFDTNGLVVREAAASGTATVMIRNSCASEGVGDGRNGFCIEENAAAMAAKLEELCRAPEVMQVVGENAQRELYVSWETAVQRAVARYEVVIDNYRSGKYPKRERFGDEFFKTQGGETSLSSSRSKDNRFDLLIVINPAKLHCIVCIDYNDYIVKFGANLFNQLFFCYRRLQIRLTLFEIIIRTVVCIGCIHVTPVCRRIGGCKSLIVSAVDNSAHVGRKVCTLTARTSKYNHCGIREVFCFVHDIVCVMLHVWLRQ